MKKIIFGILLAILVVLVAIIFQRRSGCLKEGELAENASLGPSGHFGDCCPGLEPMAKKNEIGMLGNGAYCTKIK